MLIFIKDRRLVALFFFSLHHSDILFALQPVTYTNMDAWCASEDPLGLWQFHGSAHGCKGTYSGDAIWSRYRMLRTACLEYQAVGATNLVLEFPAPRGWRRSFRYVVVE